MDAADDCTIDLGGATVAGTVSIDEIQALDRELKLELPKEIKRARELGATLPMDRRLRRLSRKNSIRCFLKFSLFTLKWLALKLLPLLMSGIA